MTTFNTCRIDRRQVAWRTVGGCVVLVNGRLNEIHRLNRLGTTVWHVLVEATGPLTATSLHAALSSRSSVAPYDLAAFLRDLALNQLVEAVAEPHGRSPPAAPTAAPGNPRHVLRPRRRRVIDMAELVHEIETTPNVLMRAVGDGFLVRFADGGLSIQTAEAALVWDLLRRAPRSFVEILDALCDEFGLSYEDAERIARPLLGMLQDRGAVRGVVRAPLLRERQAGPEAFDTAGAPAGTASASVRSLGRLDRMRLAACTTAPPSIGGGPVVRDVSGLVEHVAIICHHGINDCTPGVGPYVQRCIAELRQLNVDLIIVAGGGRHADARLREAESVAGLYRAHLPRVALWVEKHSATTWENLKNSIEMLLARSVVPQRVSVIGERAQTGKLRASCRLARRRFLAVGDVEFRVIPVARPCAGWRDRRAIQALVGSAALLRESRAAGALTLSIPPFAASSIGCGPVLRDVSGPVEHVAIVCQYGINGLTPGVGPYVQRCIAELRRLNVDLIIIAGGGRHVDASVREAESVAGLYRAYVPGIALWVENHSATTWENLKNSLEMLLARSMVPRRVSVIGDRVRTEKLRVSCWLARRRFVAVRDVEFRVIPVARQRATWRDSRAIQAFVGSALLVREFRAAGAPAVSFPSS